MNGGMCRLRRKRGRGGGQLGESKRANLIRIREPDEEMGLSGRDVHARRASVEFHMRRSGAGRLESCTGHGHGRWTDGEHLLEAVEILAMQFT